MRLIFPFIIKLRLSLEGLIVVVLFLFADSSIFDIKVFLLFLSDLFFT